MTRFIASTVFIALATFSACAAAITGTLTDATGKPVANLAIYVSNQQFPVNLYNGELGLHAARGARAATTGTDGSFSIEREPRQPYVIFAVHPEFGIADQLIEENHGPGRLSLKPWGRIEGDVSSADGKPLARARLHVGTSAIYLPMFWTSSHAVTTDGAGHFAIEHVRPGRIAIDRPTQRNQQRIAVVDVASGQPTNIRIDYDATSVRGEFVPPAGISDRASVTTLTLLRQDVQAGLSDELVDQSWGYTAEAEPGGGFAFEHIPPGRYQLSARMLAASTDRATMRSRRSHESLIAFALRDVEVPEPHDAREVVVPKTSLVRKFSRVKTGDVAPALSWPLLNVPSKSLDLASLRGNYVLLDFWSTTCGACLNDMPKVKRVYEQYGPDRLRIVGVACDRTPDPPRRFLESHDHGWLQCIVSSDDQGEQLNQMFDDARPTYVLIDPAGKVEVIANRLDEVTSALQFSLGRE